MTPRRLGAILLGGHVLVLGAAESEDRANTISRNRIPIPKSALFPKLSARAGATNTATTML
jgi:hypothetical protein